MPSCLHGFDHVIVVDWSANNTPKTGADSIWYCHQGPTSGCTSNPPTRYQAMREITGLAKSLSGRVLLGFDFPLGFAGYNIPWSLITELIEDAEDNTNNRFAVAAELNRRLTGGPAPFWGCPAKHAGPYLTAHKPPGTLPQRATEQRGAKPPWKLAYPGTCGSQSLTGIPHLQKLRAKLQDCSVWPFDQPTTRYVIAEIYPSLRGPAPISVCKDEWQVKTLATHLSDPTTLQSYLTTPLPPIASTEGWILGIPSIPASLSS
jgi:hypothetical protein